MKFTSRKLVMMALLIALAILLRRVLSIPFTMGGVHFGMVSFGGFPIILAGLLFGPMEGALVGAVSDVLGFPFMPKGPYVPFFTITAALTGMIPAFVFSLKDSRTLSLPHLFVSILLGQAITKVALVPYFQNLVFAWPFLPNALASVIVEMVHVPLYTSMAFPMLRAFASGDCQMTFHPRQALPLQPGCIDEIPGAIHDDRSVR